MQPAAETRSDAAIEQATIERLWKRVQDKTGFHTDLKAKPISYLMMMYNEMNPEDPNMGVNPAGLFYIPGITQKLSEVELTGVMGHELGHVAMGHINDPGDHSRKYEDEADDWADAHGYGEQHAAALETLKGILKSHRNTDDFDARIARIKADLKAKGESSKHLINRRRKAA